MSLLDEHPAIGYKIEILGWKINSPMKLQKKFNINMKSLK